MVIARNKLAQEMLYSHDELIESIRYLASLHTCVHCEHFNDTDEICAKYKQRPPARVIAMGCVSWIQAIPF